MGHGVRFLLTPGSMTLNCYKFQFSDNLSDSGDNNE